MTAIESPPAALVRVLIVDDTLTVRLLLRRYLDLSGRFDVIGEAIDGSDGIEHATRQQPDIILLDLAMPGMNGVEAIPHLARCSPRSVIIAVSSSDTDSAASLAIAVGADAFIAKNSRPQEMLRRIDDAWSRRRGRALDMSPVDPPVVTGTSRPGNAAPSPWFHEGVS